MRVPKSVKGNSGHAGAERKLRELTADHLDVDGVTIDGGEDETVALSANLTETPAPLGITVGRWR